MYLKQISCTCNPWKCYCKSLQVSQVSWENKYHGLSIEFNKKSRYNQYLLCFYLILISYMRQHIIIGQNQKLQPSLYSPTPQHRYKCYALLAGCPSETNELNQKLAKEKSASPLNSLRLGKVKQGSILRTKISRKCNERNHESRAILLSL